MNKPTGSTKLYNVIFPIWLLFLFPVTWAVIIPLNFIIDSIVLLLSLKLFHQQSIWPHYKRSILKVWLFGFIADFIGTGMLLLTLFIHGEWWNDHIVGPVAYNPFANGYALVYVCLAVAVSGLAIYLFNLKISFKHLDIDVSTKKRIALQLALWTAPYVFLLPTQWFY